MRRFFAGSVLILSAAVAFALRARRAANEAYVRHEPRPSMSRHRILPVLFAVLLPATPLCAELSIHSPSLPQEEDIVYAEKVGEHSWTVSQSLVFRSENDDSWYEFKSMSPESEVSIRLDAATLFPRYSEVTTRNTDSVIRRTTEILEANLRPKPNELVVGDFNSLPITCRCLPWGTFTSVNLVTLGFARGGHQFSMQLTVVGRESISAGGKTYDCWKARLGVGGFLGALIGKSSCWFAVEVPHYLVKSQGPSGGPGSPQRIRELQSYSAERSGTQRQTDQSLDPN